MGDGDPLPSVYADMFETPKRTVLVMVVGLDTTSMQGCGRRRRVNSRPFKLGTACFLQLAVRSVVIADCRARHYLHPAIYCDKASPNCSTLRLLTN